MTRSADCSPCRDCPRILFHVVSDATGISVGRMARAAMAQFQNQFEPIFVRHPFIKNKKALERILATADKQHGMVIYTIHDGELRQWLQERGRESRPPMVDMLGPMFKKVEDAYNFHPLLESKLAAAALGEKSLSLAQAIDFTLRHDDGHGLNDLGKADVILVGVSRTSKTPTSLYLSCNHGLKVANVPLVLGMDPDPKLYRLKRPRMVGLTIHPDKLAHIRRGRFGQQVLTGYSDTSHICQELAHAEDVFARIPGIKVIDVTDRPIEEVAGLIL